MYHKYCLTDLNGPFQKLCSPLKNLPSKTRFGHPSWVANTSFCHFWRSHWNKTAEETQGSPHFASAKASSAPLNVLPVSTLTGGNSGCEKCLTRAKLLVMFTWDSLFFPLEIQTKQKRIWASLRHRISLGGPCCWTVKLTAPMWNSFCWKYPEPAMRGKLHVIWGEIACPHVSSESNPFSSQYEPVPLFEHANPPHCSQFPKFLHYNGGNFINWKDFIDFYHERCC